jgi:Ribonuclease G/E
MFLGSSGLPRSLTASLILSSPCRHASRVLVRTENAMPDVTVERRSAPRHPMVLSAEVVELPRGARLSARTSDISRSGCYIDTLNPVPQGSQVRLRITHNDEVLEAIGRVVYVSPNLGMGIRFETITAEEAAKLARWISTHEEY